MLCCDVLGETELSRVNSYLNLCPDLCFILEKTKSLELAGEQLFVLPKLKNKAFHFLQELKKLFFSIGCSCQRNFLDTIRHF